MPLFAATVVYEIATLYGTEVVPQEYIPALDLSENQNEKRNMTHVWLSFFLICIEEMCNTVIGEHKIHRGSPDDIIKNRLIVRCTFVLIIHLCLILPRSLRCRSKTLSCFQTKMFASAQM